MLVQDGLGADDEASRVDAAVDAALESGIRTADLAGGAEAESAVGTDEMTRTVLAALQQRETRSWSRVPRSTSPKELP